MISIIDPEIDGGNDPILEVWAAERSKYMVTSKSRAGNTPSCVERVIKDWDGEKVYGPASDDACWKFIDAQCVKAVRKYLEQAPAENGTSPADPVQELKRIESLDVALDYAMTLERVLNNILALDKIERWDNDDDTCETFLDWAEVRHLINSSYDPKRPDPVQPDLPLDRPFNRQELDEILRGPFYDLATEVMFNDGKAVEGMSLGEIRAKFRYAIAQFKLDIRTKQNPYMIGDDGFPYILLVKAKNAMGKETLTVACTDPNIADSYREFAESIHGAVDFAIYHIPVNYVPGAAIIKGLTNHLLSVDDTVAR